MPSLSDYGCLAGAVSAAQARRHCSDMFMECTWGRDARSCVCYVYDYLHDGEPWLNSGMSFEGTPKTRIEAKFYKEQSFSLSRELADFYLQFRPGMKMSGFCEGDELFYYESCFAKRFGASFPVGLYADIPDGNGVYCRWLVCMSDLGGRFRRHVVLPCNYNFRWVSSVGGRRVIRRMWGVSRNRLSYRSGLHRWTVSEDIEDQDVCWLPMNDVSSELFYTGGDGKNMRLVVSAATDCPAVWRVSRVENHSPFGLQKLTLARDRWNEVSDFIDRGAVAGGDIYAMYADYFSAGGDGGSAALPSPALPPLSSLSSVSSSLPSSLPLPCPLGPAVCVVSASAGVIKAGGAYRSLEARFFDSAGADVTDAFLPFLSPGSWRCFIGGEDVTDAGFVSLRGVCNSNVVRVRFLNVRCFLAETLVVRCEAGGAAGEIGLVIAGM